MQSKPNSEELEGLLPISSLATHPHFKIASCKMVIFDLGIGIADELSELRRNSSGLTLEHSPAFCVEALVVLMVERIGLVGFVCASALFLRLVGWVRPNMP